MNNDSAFGERVGWDGCWGGLVGVQPTVTAGVGAVITLCVVDIFQATLPGGVTTQCALVIDTPGENSAVVGQRNAVHSACGDLNHADILGRQQGIETWTFHVNSALGSSKAELSLAAFSTNKDS